MTDTAGNHRHEPSTWRGFIASRGGIALCVFLLAAGFYLALEHRAHIIGNLWLLLPLVICSGMDFFMHGGHGHAGHDDGAKE